MNLWKTAAAFLALVAAMVFYYFYEIEGGAKRFEREQEQARFFSFDPDKITGVKYSGVKKEEGVGFAPDIIIEKSGDEWRVMEPARDRADLATLNMVVDSIASLKKGDEIDGSKTSLARFGLDKPLRIELKSDERPEPYVFLLGNASPAGKDYYAAGSDTPGVYLVDNSDKLVLSKTLFDIRDKRMFVSQDTDVTKILYKTEMISVTVVKTDDQWTLAEPIDYPADDLEIRGVLRGLRRRMVFEFVEESPKNPAKYGLENPAAVISLWTGDNAEPETVNIGLEVTGDVKGFYATRAGGNNVVKTTEDFFADFPKNLDGWRDKTLARFPPGEVTRVAISSKEGSIAGVRKEGVWDFSETMTVDDSTVDRYLNSLTIAKSEGFFIDAPTAEDLKAYGMAEPDLSITIEWKPASGEGKLATMKFAKVGEQVYFMNSDRGGIMNVSNETYDDAAKTIEDFRDKHIFGKMEIDDIKRISVERPGMTIEMEKRAAMWKITKPKKTSPDQGLANALVFSLAGAEYNEIIEENPSDLSKYGLDKEPVKITIWDTGDEIGGPVLIGDKTPEEDSYYALLEDKKYIVKIPASLVDDRLPKDVDKLKK